MQIINMRDSESIYLDNFLQFFFFSLSRHLWWYLFLHTHTRTHIFLEKLLDRSISSQHFFDTFFFLSSPREISSIRAHDWTLEMRLKHLHGIRCKWRNANAMSRGRASLGKSGLRAVLFARLSERSRSLQIFSPFFFPERAMWPRNCAEWNSSRVLRTGHAHASAKNRGSCEAKFFHEITLFIDRRPLPYLYSLANSFNLAWPGGGGKCF